MIKRLLRFFKSLFSKIFGKKNPEGYDDIVKVIKLLEESKVIHHLYICNLHRDYGGFNLKKVLAALDHKTVTKRFTESTTYEVVANMDCSRPITYLATHDTSYRSMSRKLYKHLKLTHLDDAADEIRSGHIVWSPEKECYE